MSTAVGESVGADVVVSAGVDAGVDAGVEVGVGTGLCVAVVPAGRVEAAGADDDGLAEALGFGSWLALCLCLCLSFGFVPGSGGTLSTPSAFGEMPAYSLATVSTART